MSARGVLFALDANDQRALRAAAEQGDEAVLAFIHEEVEERWEREWLFETDKAWDALHRCLTDGRLGVDNGHPPLSLAIMGGDHVIDSAHGVVSLTAAKDVPAVAAALEEVTQAWFRERYYRIAPDYGTPLSEDDLDYTWSHVEGLAALYRRAAETAERAVVFTVDV